ncbi:metal-dependent phosphohydrolase [Thermoplasmatales archaeon ex4484_36]|nr:MAG: metal-dependent phosphohydrolase [Thermoplasmatales archaeon ex4484_36]RLF56279.1 MAG: HD domain-containing protein [Thermoplasmata archaeon]HDD60086.1 HD domain-containing protein [Euryarchaeota archaeon]RLF70923.1 MAG: HD domain-containing protein [Thermoplasmata archaeon]RLF71394.1 MAG: HD domain-containing protein [Thermoplasmata archaeon]
MGAQREYKIINDPVHGGIRVEGVVLELLATPEVNKLSFIRQLGLANLVFPGANHTRFEHSLGVSFLAGRMGEVLSLPPEEIKLVRAAGLLHDLGHGPFSHTLEALLRKRIGRDHMQITGDIITGREGSGEVPVILEGAGIDPKEVERLILSTPLKEERSLESFVDGEGQIFFRGRGYLNQIIHSAIDADQLDYLLRDSHYTGVALGMVDLPRLLNTLVLYHNELMVHRRGLSALEGMLVARDLMYNAVYFHKTVRIAERMLVEAVDRLGEEKMGEVWDMVDGDLLCHLKAAGGYPAEIARRIMSRRLYKSAYILKAESAEDRHFEVLRKLKDEEELKELEEAIRRKVGGGEGEVLIDLPTGEIAVSEPRLRRADVKVLDDGRPIPVSRISSFARALQYRYTPAWYLMVCCEERLRGKVSKVAEDIIFG